MTPTIFEMSAEPGQQWNSAIKVINSNDHPLTVYANVVNFAPKGETGQGEFLPVFSEFTEGKTIAEWISVPAEAITIEPESTYQVPITVKVPVDASPGGHFAAVMIGTKPPESEGRLQIATSQIVTSLFFARIAGDVVENGSVRTFRTTKGFLSSPETTFEIRFENKGNVHLQPQGEIVITNMWGKERGIVPINHETHFGNVLPESVRKFEFTWKGERSFSDIGRYKATLTLGYGKEATQYDTQATYFWVIPIKQVGSVLLVFVGIIFFVSWAIRSYVRRMLAISGVDAYIPPTQRVRRVVQEGDVLIQRKASVRAPIEEGVRDLKNRLSQTTAFVDTLQTLAKFVVQYKKFFIGVLLLVAAICIIRYFFLEVTTLQRDYEVTIENPDANVTLSSEEIIYKKEQSVESQPIFLEDVLDQHFDLILVNSSDAPGAAADMRSKLEKFGYNVSSLKSDFGTSKGKTVIIYDVAVQDDALQLSRVLGEVQLSASVNPGNIPSISVLIGNDYSF